MYNLTFNADLSQFISVVVHDHNRRQCLLNDQLECSNASKIMISQ